MEFRGCENFQTITGIGYCVFVTTLVVVYALFEIFSSQVKIVRYSGNVPLLIKFCYVYLLGKIKIYAFVTLSLKYVTN